MLYNLPSFHGLRFNRQVSSAMRTIAKVFIKQTIVKFKTWFFKLPQQNHLPDTLFIPCFHFQEIHPNRYILAIPFNSMITCLADAFE